MQTMNWMILRWSQDWRAWIASVPSLFLIGDRFAAATSGYQPFDRQNPLAAVLEQRPLSSAESRAISWLFVLADTIFPALGALVGRGLALRPFVVTLLDWAATLGVALQNGKMAFGIVSNLAFLVAALRLAPRRSTTRGVGSRQSMEER